MKTARYDFGTMDEEMVEEIAMDCSIPNSGPELVGWNELPWNNVF